MPAGALITNAGKAIEAKRMISNTQVAPTWMGFGTAVRTAAVSDTALTTPSGARVAAAMSTITTGVTNDTYQAVATFTAAGDTDVAEIGMFDASAAGNMYVSITLGTVISLLATDAISYTIRVQYS